MMLYGSGSGSLKSVFSYAIESKCLVKSSVDKTLSLWYSCSSPSIDYSDSTPASAQIKSLVNNGVEQNAPLSQWLSSR